jgi:hypothetical protein
MRQTAREWWAAVRDYFDESERFFSEEHRPEREKAVVREFLRYLRVQFRDDELTLSPQDDDVDVRFRGARFQNVERMESGRRRHDEVRRMAKRVRTANDVSALEIPRRDSVPMGTAELLREVVRALEKKTRRMANRGSLDALVYMNLRGRHLYPAPDVIEGDTSVVAQIGWRSVSVLWPPYAVVICAQQATPSFIRAKARMVIKYPGIPWEGSASPPKSGSLAQLATSVVASLAVVGYVALGGLLIGARALREAIGTIH